MPNIEKFNSRGVSKSRIDFINKLFDSNFDDGEIELVISIQERAVNIKELSTYLELIYRLDGLLNEKGLFQYSHYPSDQIAISEIRFGSWEIVLKEVLNSINAERLAIIWLCLKYLPKIANSILEMGKNYYTLQNSREDFLEKKDKRKFRRNIRDAIMNDPDLPSSLDKKTREKIVNVIDKLYSANVSRLPASDRFNSKSIKSLRFRKK